MRDAQPASRFRRICGGAAFGPQGRKIIIGILLIGMVLFGQQLYGLATAAGRVDPALRDAAGPHNVIVVLDFLPDRFHNERIAEYGVFAGRDGALNRLKLLNVSRQSLGRLAAVAWVARIEPMQ